MKQRERRQKNAAKKDKKKARKKCSHSACPLPEGRVDGTVIHELPPEELRRRRAEPIPGAFAKLQRAELVDQPVEVIEHHVQIYRDTRTGKQLPVRWPDELADGRLLGPRLLALTSVLKAELHGSYRGIQSLYADAFEIDLSLGTLENATHRQSEALADNHAELLEAIRGQAVVNVDETGHKENGKRPLTWAATTPTLSVFRIADTRSTEELYELLGRDFHGVIGSDHFSAYLKFVKNSPHAEHQSLLAHLIRDIRFTEKLTAAGAHDWFVEVDPAVRLLFHGWHRAEPETCKEAKRRILAACEAAREIGCPEVRRLQRRIRDHASGYFRFLDDPGGGIEPTNNAAERVLRKVVTHRKVTQGECAGNADGAGGSGSSACGRRCAAGASRSSLTSLTRLSARGRRGRRQCWQGLERLRLPRKVRVPHTFTSMLMKLSAYGNQKRDGHVGFGKNAIDLYRVIAMTSEEEDRAMPGLLAGVAGDSVVARCRELVTAEFNGPDAPGVVEIRQSPGWPSSAQPDVNQFVAALGDYLGAG